MLTRPERASVQCLRLRQWNPGRESPGPGQESRYREELFMFESIGLISKPGDGKVADTLTRLVRYLASRERHLVLDDSSATYLPGRGETVNAREELGCRCDLVIVIGGDGTILGAARSLVQHEVALLGINLGRLGFLADVMPDELVARLDEILEGRFDEERRLLLEAEVEREGEMVAKLDALNEVTVHKAELARLLEFETYVDGRLVNNQRADGLIVSTPTGSTAYALSGGGPILHPNLDAIVLVPICPHGLGSRPLVVHATSEIEIRMDAGENPFAHLTCDGQSSTVLALGDRVRIRKKTATVRLIHPEGHDHYTTLRAKLHWAREL